jgi:hypothetical protein
MSYHATLDEIDLGQLQCRPQWVKTYPAGRVCAHQGCDTRLSVYNEGDYCGAHVLDQPMRYCGYPVIVCARCGEATITTKQYGASYRCGHCGRVREEATR